MISLFHIPTHIVDTGKFKHQQHDPIVREFEERLAEYVGAKYAVSLHSATAGILLTFRGEGGTEVIIPSILPPVVADAICNNDCYMNFEDRVDWVGGSYLLHEWTGCKFIDSAHRLEKDQFKNECADGDLMLFSFFPTKVLSSQDGGMIVSNNQDLIEFIRVRANNGMKPMPSPLGGDADRAASWEKKHVGLGYKMYMNSTQAYIAMKNFDNLETKKERLAAIREKYNKAFDIYSTSEHLYRVMLETTDNRSFIAKARAEGIECGIHYNALHHDDVYGYEGPELPLSDLIAIGMVSIPYHENLIPSEINKVIEFVKRNR